MKLKKKSILISVLSLVLCVSLAVGIMQRSPIVAFAVTQFEDNKYAMENGDKIHVVSWYGNWGDYHRPWDNPTDTWWSDTTLTYNSTIDRWKASEEILWQNGENLTQNFLAWWPEDYASSTDNLTEVPITLTGDVEKDDLLLARWTDKRPDDNIVNLQFDHALARFDVHLIFRDQYTNVSDISVTTNLRNEATIDFMTGNITNSGGGGIPMEEIGTFSGCDWSGTCITVPHEFNGNLLTIECIANGEEKTITYEHTGGLVFRSGERTTLTLYIGKDKVELVEVNVSGWTDGGTIDAGEAEEITP